MAKVQSSVDDKKMMQQILAAHSPDVSLVVDENSLLGTVEDIMHHTSYAAVLDSKGTSKAHLHGVSDALAFTIHKIGCELSCTCSGGDVKAITLAVFNTLVKYSWDAKVALVLSAFAINYGDFCLLSQLHSPHPLARSIFLLKPLPDISEKEALISSLMEVVIDMTECINDVMDLPSQYISRDKPPLSDALTLIPIAVYWAVKSIVFCSLNSFGLMNVSHEYVTPITEAQKNLRDFTQTLKNIHVQLSNQLVMCRKHIDDQKNNQVYYNFAHLVEKPHKDNMEVLKELIHTEDDLPLFDSVSKKKVSLDVLKGKTVILFISYPDISDEEIQEIINKSAGPKKQYEVVWIPVTDDPIESVQFKDEILRKASLMPWYSLHFSLTLQAGIISYIKKDWHFEKKPLLVVMNPQGKVMCQNAYHMMMIWGSNAFPFDAQKEETLWKEAESSWNLHFLVDEADVSKEPGVKEGSFICLYGGEDIEWIKKFTSTLKDVMKGVGITIEMIYVGKKHADTIVKENLSKYWDDHSKIKGFWARLESIWYSKMQQGQSIANDEIMKQVMTLLSANGSGQGWAVIAHGSKDVVLANGRIIIECLLQFQKLKISVTSENFISTLNNLIKEVQNTRSTDIAHKHCNHLVLPNATGIIPDKMICVDCHRPMEKYIMYKCCNE